MHNTTYLHLTTISLTSPNFLIVFYYHILYNLTVSNLYPSLCIETSSPVLIICLHVFFSMCHVWCHILKVKLKYEFCSLRQSTPSTWWWKAVAWPSSALLWEHQCQQFPFTYQDDLYTRRQHVTWWLLSIMLPEIWTRYLAMLTMVMELLCKLQEKLLSAVSSKLFYLSTGRYITSLMNIFADGREMF